MIKVGAFAYLAGGLLFGIALYRARVLARWAAALLAVGGIVTAALSVMPDALYRLLAFPNGIAMIALATRCGAHPDRCHDAADPGRGSRTVPTAGAE